MDYDRISAKLEKVRFLEDYNVRLSFWDSLLTELKGIYPETVKVITAQEILLSPYNNNELLYRDDDHLNYSGANLICNEIKKKILF